MAVRSVSALEELVVQRRTQHPQETFLKWRDQTISWEAFLDHIYAMAAGFWEAGIRIGDRAAIMMGNHPEFLYTYYALNFLGVGVVPINTAQRGETLAYILQDSGASSIVVDEDLLPHIEAVQERAPRLRLTVIHAFGRSAGGGDAEPIRRGGTVTVQEWLAAAGARPPIDPNAGTVADNILYTSGTTGAPKGCVNRGINPANILKLWEPTGVRPRETIYTCLPLFHGNALAVSALGAILGDFTLALGEHFSASRFWDECRRYEAVEFNTLGAMIPILLKQPPRPDDADNPVRVVLSAACPAHAWRPFEERFGLRIIEWFGMVDAPGFLMNTTGKVGAMGKPLPGFAFRVVDEQDQDVAPGQVGELVFHQTGAAPAAFYYGKDDATREAWRGDWFHSGDLAKQDDEGDFYYAGRKKESMRRRGENISAWEIEAVVNQHPKVLESAAHAVPAELGEDEVKLVVVLKPGETVTPEELLQFCRGKMAYYALPRYIEFRAALPKTGTHRIQYGLLKQEGVTAATWDREAVGYTIARE